MSQRICRKNNIRLLALAALVLKCSPVGSSAYQLMEQNVTNLGTAYAGTASLAEDASTGFYNSAGLTRICQEQIAFSLIGIKSYGHINVNRALDTQGGTVTSPVRAPTSVRIINSDGLAPGIHYAYRLSDCWVFGLNVVMPFGLKTGYREDSIARYSSTRSEIRTYDIAPSLAYCFGNGLSLGAGLDIVYAYAELDTRIAPIAGSTTTTDGFINTRAENWGLGGHLGALYEFNNCTRIGANYRSEVQVNARGETLQQNSATLAPAITSTGVKAYTRLPATAVLSAYHKICDWAIMGDIQWTNWSTFKSLTLRPSNGTGTQTLVQNFKDTFRVALGLNYQWDDCWLFRIGTAYDQSPVRKELRSTRIPDTDRYWLAVGARYNFTPCLRLEVGYAHLYFTRSVVNDFAPVAAGAQTQGRQFLNGNVRNAADLVGLQLTWDLA